MGLPYPASEAYLGLLIDLHSKWQHSAHALAGSHELPAGLAKQHTSIQPTTETNNDVNKNSI